MWEDLVNNNKMDRIIKQLTMIGRTANEGSRPEPV
jgi:hypothetical protein